MTEPFRARNGQDRSLALQSIKELGGKLSVLSRQKIDHLKLGEYLDQLGKASPREQQIILLSMYPLVFPHAFAEETVLWPVIRRMLPNGQALTLEVEREHQQVNELVAALERTSPHSEVRTVLLARLIALLAEDIRDEEDVLLPALQSKLSRTQLIILGLVWEIVKRGAPTRAHPIVSRRPPGNVLAAAPLSLLDRSTDRLDLMRQRGGIVAGLLLGSLSSVLSRASGAVERLPALQRGQDPATRPAVNPKHAWSGPALVSFGLLATAATMILWRQGKPKGVQPRDRRRGSALEHGSPLPQT